MPKRIVILDPNGVEVAAKYAQPALLSNEGSHLRVRCLSFKETPGQLAYIAPAGPNRYSSWRYAAETALDEFLASLIADPKLGTYTVTIKEVE